MKSKAAVTSFDALSHEGRLTIFKMLVKKGKEGMNAGDISKELKIAPATLSFHMSQLLISRLVMSRKEGRYVIYSADFEAVKHLIAYLLQNCCEESEDSNEKCEIFTC